MRKNIVNFWCWVISFSPYRGVKRNSVLGMKIDRNLEPLELKLLVNSSAYKFSKKLNK